MKGKILDFAAADGQGVIAGDDGNRYTFAGAEWRARDAAPAAGARVDFVGEAGQAREVYVDVPQPAAAPTGNWGGPAPVPGPERNTVGGTNPVTLVLLLVAVVVIAFAIYWFGVQRAGIDDQLRQIEKSIQGVVLLLL